MREAQDRRYILGTGNPNGRRGRCNARSDPFALSHPVDKGCKVRSLLLPTMHAAGRLELQQSAQERECRSFEIPDGTGSAKAGRAFREHSHEGQHPRPLPASHLDTWLRVCRTLRRGSPWERRMKPKPEPSDTPAHQLLLW